MRINIVYATILGTSQMVAEELDDALSDKYEIDVQIKTGQIGTGHQGKKLYRVCSFYNDPFVEVVVEMLMRFQVVKVISL